MAQDLRTMAVRAQIVSSSLCAIDAAGAKGRSVPCVSRLDPLVSCRDQIVLVAESVTCIRHFVPKFNFIRCFERRDQFPLPVHSPVASSTASAPPCLFNIPRQLASTLLAVANHPSLDPGNREYRLVLFFPSSVPS
jgi:hypothetical protein